MERGGKGGDATKKNRGGGGSGVVMDDRKIKGVPGEEVGTP